MKNDNTIVVRLPDGYKLRVSKYAKKNKVSISEVIREAIAVFLGGIL